MKLYQKIVYNQVKAKERVIDLGCGDGLLLEKLRREKQCEGYGIEKDFEEVILALSRGIPLFQGDIIEGLKQFETNSFDVAILSQTLQQVMRPVNAIPLPQLTGFGSVVCSFFTFVKFSRVFLY